MRGRGFTTCEDSLEVVVFQAIYTRVAAKAQTQALLTNVCVLYEPELLRWYEYGKHG